MGVLREAENLFTVEGIIQHELDKVVTEYDNKLYTAFTNKDYNECEQYLTDFCFALLDLEEMNQLFVARIFFVSVVTDIIRTQKRKEKLSPRSLSTSYHLISQIEEWENISEFILHSRWLVEQLKRDVMDDHLHIDGCKYVESALGLIDDFLEEDMLTVKWLANQLGISSTHLNNLFKLQIGETVSQFIIKRKMKEIIFELSYTNRSLKEVREKYGYHNHSHFIQHFKKHQGITPLKFRQQLHSST